MKWENFKDLFEDTWHEKMRPFIESEECDKIYDHLKKRGREEVLIVPRPGDTYRCFVETKLTDLKVVMMGMCPYHTMRDEEIIADGLLMSCSRTKKLQPSLDQFYNALEEELYNGLNLNFARLADLSYLAAQGVLLFNAAMTTEFNKVGAHNDLWQPFTKYVMEEIIAPSGVPVVFLGKDAGAYKRYLAPMQWSFVLSHPASASYKGTKWNSESAFTKVNKILREEGKEEIMWLYNLPF